MFYLLSHRKHIEPVNLSFREPCIHTRKKNRKFTGITFENERKIYQNEHSIFGRMKAYMTTYIFVDANIVHMTHSLACDGIKVNVSAISFILR